MFTIMIFTIRLSFAMPRLESLSAFLFLAPFSCALDLFSSHVNVESIGPSFSKMSKMKVCFRSHSILQTPKQWKVYCN